MARLTEQNWLDHGLKTLAKSGFASLKAATMAEALGVSRGSFYWHFKDIFDFQTRLLAHWRSRTTDMIIREMDAKSDADQRLPDLMIRAFAAKADLDRAIRVWATYDAQARAHLMDVDKLRMDYIKSLLKAAGLADDIASQRARFLYAASLGDAAIAPDVGRSFTTEDLKRLAALLVL